MDKSNQTQHHSLMSLTYHVKDWNKVNMIWNNK